MATIDQNSLVLSDHDSPSDMPTPLGKTLSTRRTMSLLSGGISPFIQALLTDLYQLTMCYGYWKAKKHEDHSVFDLFFRKNPFQGEYTIFCGLDECLKFLENFRFTPSDIDYLKTVFPPGTEEEFFSYLASLDASRIVIRAIPEGTVVFPKIPLIIVEGPLAICQLLESTMLNLVNYASLVGTNAARFRHAAGQHISLLEFGLRRAQGPNGGLCASKYCYIGGFDGTSNLLAGKLYHIPVKGTMAHSFVSSFSSAQDLKVRTIRHTTNGSDVDLMELSLKYKGEVVALLPGVVLEEVVEGELASFCAYAIAFPNAFLALIDTYDVLRSGLVNYCCVALALWDCGYKAMGVRIDSGDLAYLSRETRKHMIKVAERYQLEWLGKSIIVASNDINEDTIYSLNEQKHEINSFGVGTHLVTCQKQPALGCVFKLVEVQYRPRIKLSQDTEKITIPGKKKAFRLYSKHGHAINDLLVLEDEQVPTAGKPILCRHPFQENKRAYVTPIEVEELHRVFWAEGKLKQELPDLEGIKTRVKASLATIRDDSKRNLNPTPFKVSLSEKLYDFVHSLWLSHAPIGQLE